MYKSRNKPDLIIEVWEYLDCETVGAAEIISIEGAVRERFGKSAVESPMIIARMLADEGAELRHSEIMELYLKRSSEPGQTAAFRNILNFLSFDNALTSIRNLENLRKKLLNENDKEGLRLLREKVIQAKKELALSATQKITAEQQLQKKEIGEWLTIWLQSPEVFENWIGLRQRSADFIEKFGNVVLRIGQ